MSSEGMPHCLSTLLHKSLTLSVSFTSTYPSLPTNFTLTLSVCWGDSGVTVRWSVLSFWQKLLYCLLVNNYMHFETFKWDIWLLTSFQAETTIGIIIPAIFDRTSRCPDEIVRRIWVSMSYEDANWNGKLLETYDCGIDYFKISPCRW